MGEFFRGWKRKIGVLTLLMALLAMGGWVRSVQKVDNLVLAFGKISWKVHSKSGILEIMRHRRFGSEPIPYIGRTGWYSHKPGDFEFDWCGERNTDFYGFRFAYGNRFFAMKTQGYGSQVETNMIAFPHWYIIAPLTLVSAFLLLSKSRKPNQKKTTERIQAEGT